MTQQCHWSYSVLTQRHLCYCLAKAYCTSVLLLIDTAKSGIFNFVNMTQKSCWHSIVKAKQCCWLTPLSTRQVCINVTSGCTSNSMWLCIYLHTVGYPCAYSCVSITCICGLVHPQSFRHSKMTDHASQHTLQQKCWQNFFTPVFPLILGWLTILYLLVSCDEISKWNWTNQTPSPPVTSPTSLYHAL